MPTFIGLDLAWTTHRESGVCWFEGESPEDVRCTRLEAAVCETRALADEIAAVDGPVVATIDAPLLYTPERWAEREIARRFGRYKAAAHSAHAAVRRGYTAGIDLGNALIERGFTADPAPLLRGESGRFAVEIYPHTVHVRLFGLSERLPYKPRPHRTVGFRQGVMREYQGHLRALMEREAPGALRNPGVRQALAARTAETATGAGLKRLDDTLDGLTCALSAWLLWSQPERWETLGDLNGYIVAPREA
jgi:predicted RNase H-like nuclease